VFVDLSRCFACFFNYNLPLAYLGFCSVLSLRITDHIFLPVVVVTSSINLVSPDVIPLLTYSKRQRPFFNAAAVIFG